MKTLVTFLTHKASPHFTRLVHSVNPDKYDVLVLIDSSKAKHNGNYDGFNSIREVVSTCTAERDTSMPYDSLGGHTMYINHFRKHPELLEKYDYIYLFEYDVYFHGGLEKFITAHNDPAYHSDLLVPEYGLRYRGWRWFKSLKGYAHNYNVGCKVYAMRLSKDLFTYILEHLGNRFDGYVEALLPRLCQPTVFTQQVIKGETRFSMNRFRDTTIGTTAISEDSKILKYIKQDILDGTENYIENRLYHPIKL